VPFVCSAAVFSSVAPGFELAARAIVRWREAARASLLFVLGRGLCSRTSLFVILSSSPVAVLLPADARAEMVLLAASWTGQMEYGS